MSLTEVSHRLQEAERAAGRPEGSVRLIAVSKVQPEDRITAVLDQGHRLFGENRVQEAAGRWPALQKRFDGIELHLLGPLQSNKARQAIELFDAIHSLDRPKLARSLARLAQEVGRCPKLFVQVNTGDESQKAGIAPDQADSFIDECRALDLPVIGLMCIPPADMDPRPHFDLLAEIAARNGLSDLSMGMSGDYPEAVAAGATVRCKH